MTTREKILTWAVVMMVVFNLTTVGAVLYGRYCSDRDVPIVVDDEGTALDGRCFRQKIGFDREQMRVYRDASREFTPVADSIIGKIEMLKGEIFAELNSERCDMRRMDSLSEEVGRCHARLKSATNRFYLKMKSECTPEQLKRLEDVFLPLFHNCDECSEGGKCCVEVGQQ